MSLTKLPMGKIIAAVFLALVVGGAFFIEKESDNWGIQVTRNLPAYSLIARGDTQRVRLSSRVPGALRKLGASKIFIALQPFKKGDIIKGTEVQEFVAPRNLFVISVPVSNSVLAELGEVISLVGVGVDGGSASSKIFDVTFLGRYGDQTVVAVDKRDLPEIAYFCVGRRRLLAARSLAVDGVLKP